MFYVYFVLFCVISVPFLVYTYLVAWQGIFYDNFIIIYSYLDIIIYDAFLSAFFSLLLVLSEAVH